MKKVLLVLVFGFLFLCVVILKPSHPEGSRPEGSQWKAKDSSFVPLTQNDNFNNGYQDGYRDAMDGVQSLCATRRCISQDPYERGYKLGYKKGIKERGLIEPNIDSPLRTIGSDFNGDGIHDIIVGAHVNNDGAVDAGAVYIFFGASTLSGTKSLGEGQSADVTFLGKAASDILGRTASTAGDVNGDGFDDIIVGAPQNNDGPGANNAGAAYIFFGASTLSGTKTAGTDQNFQILGKAASDYLGFSVSGAGDVNGDGFDDVIVGANSNDDGPGIDAGAAYIFFGASNLSGTKSLGEGQSADVTILGKADSDKLGSVAASGAGDVNGDGFDDIIVGARYNDDGAANAGAAYIFFGASTLSGTKSLGGGQSADVTVLGKAASDQLSFSGVSGAGDINGDGFDDIIVGAYLNDDGPGIDAGAAYIFFGASTLSGTKTAGTDQNFQILGKADSDQLGLGVSGAGDVNDDGFDDIIVGARYNDDGAGANKTGAAYIFFGASTLSGTKSLGEGQSADVTILGKAALDSFGFGVSGVGDVNNDGLPDFIAGANLNDDGPGNNAGAAYIFFGASTLSGTKSLGQGQSADVTTLGKADTDRMGFSVGGGRSNPGP